MLFCLCFHKNQYLLYYFLSLLPLLFPIYFLIYESFNRINKINVNLIRDTAENAIINFEDNTIDILHIDGNHDYSSVLNDLKLYSKKIELFKKNKINLNYFSYHPYLNNQKDDFSILHLLFTYKISEIKSGLLV